MNHIVEIIFHDDRKFTGRPSRKINWAKLCAHVNNEIVKNFENTTVSTHVDSEPAYEFANINLSAYHPELFAFVDELINQIDFDEFFCQKKSIMNSKATMLYFEQGYVLMADADNVKMENGKLQIKNANVFLFDNYGANVIHIGKIHSAETYVDSIHHIVFWCGADKYAEMVNPHPRRA